MIRKLTVAGAVVLMGLLAPAAASAATPSTASQLAYDCPGGPPGSGSVPYDKYSGSSPAQACLKCSEMGQYLRAKGEISAYWCEYYDALGYARLYGLTS